MDSGDLLGCVGESFRYARWRSVWLDSRDVILGYKVESFWYVLTSFCSPPDTGIYSGEFLVRDNIILLTS